MRRPTFAKRYGRRCERWLASAKRHAPDYSPRRDNLGVLAREAPNQ